MKQIFALGTVILSGALLTAACVASDSDSDPDTTENSGGAGGAGGSGGSGNAGGTGNAVNTATSGGNGGSGGTYSSGGNGGSGGTYSSGGSGGTAGSGGTGEGGWAGDDSSETTETSTTGWQTTTTTGTSTTGGGGSPSECLGDDDVSDLPDCADLAYADVECSEFTPPEPLGVTMCKQFAEHATPEAFAAVFDCLDMIEVEDNCSEDTHDAAVWDCTDNGDTGVAANTCASTLAVEKCANLGCSDIDPEPYGECDAYLSMFTAAGVDHVIACTNDNLGDDNGGQWGEGPECAEVFEGCVAGFLQPTH